MKRIHYKIKGFRLSDKIIGRLEILKQKNGVSYNLLFKDLILNYDGPDEAPEEETTL